MIQKFDINGDIYEFDGEHISVREAMMLKTATGLNLRPFGVGLNELDPECMVALGWLLLTRAGKKGPDGQPILLKDVDFDTGTFFVELEPGEPVDPTPGEDSTSPKDSTSPELSTSTD